MSRISFANDLLSQFKAVHAIIQYNNSDDLTNGGIIKLASYELLPKIAAFDIGRKTDLQNYVSQHTCNPENHDSFGRVTIA